MKFITKSRTDLLHDLLVAPVGAEVVYHVGNLMTDRQWGPSFLGVHNTARTAWEAMERGEVILTQRKIANTDGSFTYVYRATKLKPPHKAVIWRGCYRPDRFTQKKDPRRFALAA